MVAAVMGGLVGAAAGAAPPDLDQAIRARVGVSAYSLQPFAPVIAADGSFTATFDLGGRIYTSAFAPDPVNAPDCTVVLEDGSATPQVVPAPASCTYRGSVQDMPGSVCSGSLIDGRLTAVIVLPGIGSWSVLPLTEVSAAAPAVTHIVTSNDDVVPGPWKCGVPDHPAPAGATVIPRHGPTQTGGTDTPLICELACEADFPFFQLVGSNASGVAQDISTVIANVSSYYWLSGINIRFRVVRYVIRVTAQGNPGLYATTDPDTLLTNFRTVWNNLAGAIPRDTAHMFTGQDLDGNIVGLAYLSSVCTTQIAYGLSQSRFTLQPGRRAALTAHELGHNFSAQHCDAVGSICDPCWIMLTTLGNTTNELTRLGCSAPIINSYGATRPCMSFGTASCPADFDHNGQLDLHDYAAFQTAIAAGDLRADMDGDGRLTINDFVVFQSDFAAGCP
jgi:hypothetical protein